MTPIVSVHLPKTGGSSFREALEEHFKDRLLLDYSMPFGSSRTTRHKTACLSAISLASNGLGGFACVHGHFLPVKYLLLSSFQRLQFVVWLRDPVSRLVSHYHYWREKAPTASSITLHRRMIEEDWSLERFCLSSEMRNLYSEFLWGFPIESFDFIGRTEMYESDLGHFSKRFLNRELPAFHLNQAAPSGLRALISPKLRGKVEEFQGLDMELYDRAMTLREKMLRES